MPHTLPPPSARTIICDGTHHADLAALGHPRIYLALPNDGQVTCPYCSRVFSVSQHALPTPCLPHAQSRP